MNPGATTVPLRPPARPVRVAPGRARVIPWTWVVLFLAAHAPLGVMLGRFGGSSKLHSLLLLGLGLFWAVSNQPRRVAAVVAYIASAEILWRMTGGAVLWEFGKYAMGAICLTSIVVGGRLRLQASPILYFLLLVPAAVITIFTDDWWSARRDVSFNLSGPFAVMVGVIFFSQLKLSRAEVNTVLMWLLAPLIAIAGITVHAVFGSSISFGDGSSELASGGFGPNQVSSALGLGMLIAFLGIMDPKMDRRVKLVFFGVILVFAMQSALTLSRSGLGIGVLCIAAASWFFVRDTATRLKLVGAGALIVAVGWFIIFPRLDAFTGGAISRRFTNSSATGRDTIMLVDLKIWMNYPIFGVGMGEAQMERMKYYRLIAAHNEFTRMVAEHGSLGFVSALLFLGMAWHYFRRSRGAYNKALVASMMAYAILFMVGNGMRLALVPFTFCFATAILTPPSGRRRRLRPVVGAVPEIIEAEWVPEGSRGASAAFGSPAPIPEPVRAGALAVRALQKQGDSVTVKGLLPTEAGVALEEGPRRRKKRRGGGRGGRKQGKRG